MVTSYLGLGSNLEDRHINIKSAVKKIGELKETQVIKLSKIIETKPLGGPPGQGKFLNAVLKIRTSLSPVTLLKELKKIEKSLGRKKCFRFGPRKIDLDILLFGGKIINTKGLTVPHPRMFEREFVLRPLLEAI